MYRITTYEDDENLINPTYEKHHGNIYSVVPILDLEKRLAKYKKMNNKNKGQKRASKTDYVILYFHRMAHLQGDEPDEKDIQLGDVTISGEN